MKPEQDKVSNRDVHDCGCVYTEYAPAYGAHYILLNTCVDHQPRAAAILADYVLGTQALIVNNA